MALAVVLANVSRILARWRAVDGRAVAAYAAIGEPGAVLGGRMMLVLPPRAVDLAIGAFLRATIPARLGEAWVSATGARGPGAGTPRRGSRDRMSARGIAVECEGYGPGRAEPGSPPCSGAGISRP